MPKFILTLVRKILRRTIEFSSVLRGLNFEFRQQYYCYYVLTLHINIPTYACGLRPAPNPVILTRLFVVANPSVVPVAGIPHGVAIVVVASMNLTMSNIPWPTAGHN